MLLAAVLQTVAPTVSPLVTPEVVKETLQPIIQNQTPEVVMQLATMAGLAVTTFVVSMFHQVIEWLTTKSKAGGWNGNLNRGLATVYSVGLALLTAFQTGDLKPDASGIALSVSSISVALASTFFGYELRAFFLKLMGYAKMAPEVKFAETPEDAVA